MKENILSVIPGSEGNKSNYYSNSDREPFCVGHIRGDFGKSGDEYWATFWEHEGINTAREGYKEELTALVNTLRKNLIKSRKAIRKYIQQHPPLILDAGEIMTYGYQVSTEKYDYYIRCSPYPGVYDFYIYMYIREV